MRDFEVCVGMIETVEVCVIGMEDIDEALLRLDGMIEVSTVVVVTTTIDGGGGRTRSSPTLLALTRGLLSSLDDSDGFG